MNVYGTTTTTWPPQTSWPLQSFLELGPLPSAVPCARLHARQVVWEWGLVRLSEDIELIVSELVTNAVRASEGLMPGVPHVRLWLCSDRDQSSSRSGTAATGCPSAKTRGQRQRAAGA
jgi:hypothetical protein